MAFIFAGAAVGLASLTGVGLGVYSYLNSENVSTISGSIISSPNPISEKVSNSDTILPAQSETVTQTETQPNDSKIIILITSDDNSHVVKSVPGRLTICQSVMDEITKFDRNRLRPISDLPNISVREPDLAEMIQSIKLRPVVPTQKTIEVNPFLSEITNFNPELLRQVV